jgi:type II secretory pathway pseudopilin PulG
MSLLELLVVAALLLVLFGLVYAFLVPGLRAWRRSESASHAQQQCLTVVSTVVREFQFAHPELTRVIADASDDGQGHRLHHDAVVFVSSIDGRGGDQADGAGDTLWQSIVYIYQDAESGQVRMRHVAIDPPVIDPPRPDVTLFHPEPDDRIVARHVSSLKLRLVGGSGNPPLEVSVEARDGERESEMEGAMAPLVMSEPIPSSP